MADSFIAMASFEVAACLCLGCYISVSKQLEGNEWVACIAVGVYEYQTCSASLFLDVCQVINVQCIALKLGVILCRMMQDH
jgi:hypothetical protein